MQRFAYAVIAGVALQLGFASGAAAAEPDTSFDSAPSGQSILAWPTVAFSSDQQDASFECSLDQAPFSVCSSPDVIGPLALGTHTFTVRAVAANGALDSTPATRTWEVVTSPSATPKIKLTLPRATRVRARTLRAFMGSASAVSGVTEVQIALQRGGPDRDYFPPRCTYLGLHSGATVYRPCLLPPYVSASGTRTWRYDVPRRVRRHLGTGKWSLVVRAFNAFDIASKTYFSLKFD